MARRFKKEGKEAGTCSESLPWAHLRLVMTGWLLQKLCQSFIPPNDVMYEIDVTAFCYAALPFS